LGNSCDREVIGVGAIDAPDEGIDEAIVDLVSESRTNPSADRIMVVGRARPDQIESGAGHAEG
jgi:hypothetical protein